MRFRRGLLSVSALMVLGGSLVGCSKPDAGADAPPGANDVKQAPREAPPNKPKLQLGTSGGGGGSAKPTTASPN